jgi:hypothetical protein
MRGFAARVGWVVVSSLRMTKGTPLIVVKPTSQTRRGLATPVMIETCGRLPSNAPMVRTVGKDWFGASAVAVATAPPLQAVPRIIT